MFLNFWIMREYREKYVIILIYFFIKAVTCTKILIISSYLSTYIKVLVIFGDFPKSIKQYLAKISALFYKLDQSRQVDS